jgi:hypothetical protein
MNGKAGDSAGHRRYQDLSPRAELKQITFRP